MYIVVSATLPLTLNHNLSPLAFSQFVQFPFTYQVFFLFFFSFQFSSKMMRCSDFFVYIETCLCGKCYESFFFHTSSSEIRWEIVNLCIFFFLKIREFYRRIRFLMTVFLSFFSFFFVKFHCQNHIFRFFFAFKENSLRNKVKLNWH